MAKRVPKARQNVVPIGNGYTPEQIEQGSPDEGAVSTVTPRRTEPLGMTNKPGPKSRRRTGPPDVQGRGGAWGDREIVVGASEKPQRRMEVQVRITGKMAELWMGLLSVKDMDNEELARMQFRDKNGTFSGHPPRALPAVLVAEMRRELVERATAMFDGSLLGAIKALTDIATNSDFDPKDRLRAANLIIERSLGKVSETLTVQGNPESPVEILLTKIDRSRPPARVIEGQVVHTTLVPEDD